MRYGRIVPRRLEIVQKRTYEETNRLLLDGEIDVAFICTGAYVAIRDRVRLLAVPVVQGSPTYASVLLARRGGPASIEALRGVRFAFTDPLSNTGRLYPIYLLGQRFSATPREFFGAIVYSGANDESIRLVLAGVVDAAAVDCLVWEEFARRQPAQAGELSLIHRSPPFGAALRGEPRPGSRDRRDRRAILLGMAEDAGGCADSRRTRGGGLRSRGGLRVRDRGWRTRRLRAMTSRLRRTPPRARRGALSRTLSSRVASWLVPRFLAKRRLRDSWRC